MNWTAPPWRENQNLPHKQVGLDPFYNDKGSITTVALLVQAGVAAILGRLYHIQVVFKVA